MDKLNRSLRVVETLDNEVAVDAAEAVGDFAELAAIFDRELAQLGHTDDETRKHIANAKAAAERGIELAQQLVRLLHQRR